MSREIDLCSCKLLIPIDDNLHRYMGCNNRCPTCTRMPKWVETNTASVEVWVWSVMDQARGAWRARRHLLAATQPRGTSCETATSRRSIYLKCPIRGHRDGQSCELTLPWRPQPLPSAAVASAYGSSGLRRLARSRTTASTSSKDAWSDVALS